MDENSDVQEYAENDPLVIAANAEAQSRITLAEAEVLKARSQLHPFTQTMYVLWDGVVSLVGKLTSLLGIIAFLYFVVVIACVFKCPEYLPMLLFFLPK